MAASSAGRPERQDKGGKRRDWRTLLSLAVLVALIGIVVFARVPLVTAAPGLAGFYHRVGLPVNTVGLAFEDVHTIRDVADGAPGLVVEGKITNVTSASVDVPPIRLVLMDGADIQVGGWQAEVNKRRLAPGDSQTFRTRLASPPDSAKKVSVSFVATGVKG